MRHRRNHTNARRSIRINGTVVIHKDVYTSSSRIIPPPASPVPGASPDSLPQRQPAIQELRPALAKRPILGAVGAARDDELRGRQVALLVEGARQRLVEGLLHGLVAALLEDLHKDELVGALVAEARVFADPGRSKGMDVSGLRKQGLGRERKRAPGLAYIS